MTDIFQELYQYWRKIKNPAKKQKISKILLASKLRAHEINALRRDRAILREQAQQKANINGNLQIGEMHMLEYQACQELCPMLKIGKGSAKTQGWKWVRRQPWAKDLLAPNIRKRFY